MLWIRVAIILIGLIVLKTLVHLFFPKKRGRKRRGRSTSDSTGEKKGPGQYSYEKASSLFTRPERSFLPVLEQAVGSKAKVYGKVRIADILEPQKGHSRRYWRGAFRRISQKHFDYVLCANDDLRILCAIELDDSSHKRKDRQERDAFVDEACASAGLPLLHVTVSSSYVIEDVRRRVAPHVPNYGKRVPDLPAVSFPSQDIQLPPL